MDVEPFLLEKHTTDHFAFKTGAVLAIFHVIRMRTTKLADAANSASAIVYKELSLYF